VLRSDDSQLPQVRQRCDTWQVGVVEIDQALLERHHRVFGGALGLLDECRGNPSRTSSNLDRLRYQIVGKGGVGIDREQRHSLAVYRDFDLLPLALTLAPERTANVVIERQPKHVVAISGKIMHYRQAAAGAERRAFDVS